MRNYDPNIHKGVHTVEITIQKWDYAGHIKQRIGGNCKGKNILDFDFESEDADLENDCNLRYDEDYDCFSATLKNENGDILEVEGDSEEFNDMIVKMEILDYEKENESE